MGKDGCDGKRKESLEKMSRGRKNRRLGEEEGGVK